MKYLLNRHSTIMISLQLKWIGVCSHLSTQLIWPQEIFLDIMLSNTAIWTISLLWLLLECTNFLDTSYLWWVWTKQRVTYYWKIIGQKTAIWTYTALCWTLSLRWTWTWIGADAVNAWRTITACRCHWYIQW